MNYHDFEKVLSSARLSRYLEASGKHEGKALYIYRYNIRLSQGFYALLSLFEIALRNAIDQHYTQIFGESEWIKNQCVGTGFLNNPVFAAGRYKSKKIVNDSIRNLGVRYTHDRLVASLSFGFWVNLFAPMQFRFGGQNLHKIFINRPIGTKPKDLYNQLSSILDFRNRVAHHEPICFNKGHQMDLYQAQKYYASIIEITNWLGLDSNEFFKDLDKIQEIFDENTRL